MKFVEFPESFEQWRDSARALIAEGVAPQDVLWGNGASQGALFHALPAASLVARSPDVLQPAAPAFAVPKEFVDLARTLACHREPDRWSLLYRLLFRLTHGERNLLKVDVDPDVHEALMREKAIRRDMHKMKAFVRFRKVDRDGVEQYIAWHRPDHFIVERMAPWFAERFGSMHWSILTPDRSAHWDTHELTFGPGVPRSEAPSGDDLEELWRSYYAAIFNPARLKIKAMKAEMAVRHWATLPEAQLIPELIQRAAGREETMRTTQKTSAAPFVPVTDSLRVLAQASQACEGCDLFRHATQAVFGQGPHQAQVVMVGEQPGDSEDVAGLPFVGPAGKLLDRAMEQAGLDRTTVYVTNAVKHFKFEERGKRRIHKKPSGGEIAACHPWLEAELALIRPKLIVALGSTAALALAGKDFKITRDRGRFFPHPSGSELFATLHPSALLRMPEPERREAEYTRFVEDLRMIQTRIEEMRAA
jgi:uracil-DNA glycosylase